MTVLSHPAAKPLHRAPRSGSGETVRKLLLACGVAYPLLYVAANDVIAASLYDGYSRSSQAISELSATGAPTHALLTALVPVFCVLLIAFGVGVWRSAGDARSLRVVGGLFVAQAITAFSWLVAPMSQREQIAAHGGALEDLLHLVLSGASLLFIVAELGFGSAAFGRAFRSFSIAMIVVFLASAGATGLSSRAMVSGQPTPWLGLVERVMLGAWLTWMAVLAIALMLRRVGAVSRAARTRLATGSRLRRDA